MKLKIKRLHEDAVIPKYAKSGDAGFDLVAVSLEKEYGKVKFKFGLAFEIPVGYVGLIFPRSSIERTKYSLCNAVGVIDSGYRGEVAATFDVVRTGGYYQVGDRVAQMVIVPFESVEFEEVDDLSDTDRGTGGFGSTGK